MALGKIKNPHQCDAGLATFQVAYILKHLKKFVLGYSGAPENVREYVNGVLNDCISKCEKEENETEALA